MPVRKRLSTRGKRSKAAGTRRQDAGVAVILSTFASEEAARAAAHAVINLRLCACVNLLNVRSIYRWKGQICDESEVAAFFKTSSDRADVLRAALLEMHPYEVPEVLELRTESSSKAYLEWVIESSDGIAQQGDNSA